MAARSALRLMGYGVNLQLVIISIEIFPSLISNDILVIITILNILISLSFHNTILLALASIEQPILFELWSLIRDIGDPTLQYAFIAGCIIHLTIIQNQLLVNIL